MYLETFVGTFLFLSIEEEIYGSLSLSLSLSMLLAGQTNVSSHLFFRDAFEVVRYLYLTRAIP